MIRALEWGIGIILFLGFWLGLYDGKFFPSFVRKNELLVAALPLISIVAFGVFSILFVFYKAVNIKDCPAASDELKAEIELAKVDLKKKGISIDN